MNAVIDRKLMRLGNILVVTMAIILASIIIAVAQVMTTGDAAVPPQQTEPARVLLKPPPAKPRIAMPDNIAPSAPVGDALKKLLAEHRCLAEVMYFEARGEGPVGQAAIARVIFHRLASGGHGSTICAVVYEGAHQTFCQFTFACDGSLDRPRVPEPWRAAQVLAARLMAAEFPGGDQTDGATYYHTVAVHPTWAPRMERVTQIGNHVFYRAAQKPRLETVAFRGSLQ
jgi:hypothetical protein